MLHYFETDPKHHNQVASVGSGTHPQMQGQHGLAQTQPHLIYTYTTATHPSPQRVCSLCSLSLALSSPFCFTEPFITWLQPAMPCTTPCRGMCSSTTLSCLHSCFSSHLHSFLPLPPPAVFLQNTHPSYPSFADLSLALYHPPLTPSLPPAMRYHHTLTPPILPDISHNLPLFSDDTKARDSSCINFLVPLNVMTYGASQSC